MQNKTLTKSSPHSQTSISVYLKELRDFFFNETEIKIKFYLKKFYPFGDNWSLSCETMLKSTKCEGKFES